MGKLAYSVNEAAASLGVHPDSIRRAVRRGELPVFKLGRRTLIPVSELTRFLTREAQPEKVTQG